MPMLTAAVLWYFAERYRATRGISIGEALILTLALILPFAMVTLRNTGFPVSWARASAVLVDRGASHA